MLPGRFSGNFAHHSLGLAISPTGSFFLPTPKLGSLLMEEFTKEDAMITQIKAQIYDWTDWGKEWRVMIEWTDEAGQLHEGCYHYTGNPYTPKGQMEDLTSDVLIEAIRLAVYPNADGKMSWHSLSAEECRLHYLELQTRDQPELDDIWAEFFESAHYTGS
jgi:hypothetical protein